MNYAGGGGGERPGQATIHLFSAKKVSEYWVISVLEKQLHSFYGKIIIN